MRIFYFVVSEFVFDLYDGSKDCIVTKEGFPNFDRALGSHGNVASSPATSYEDRRGPNALHGEFIGGPPCPFFILSKPLIYLV